MIIHEEKQGSAGWLACRLGRITASEVDALVSSEGKVRTGEGPKSYLCRKVCEKALGYAQDTGASFHMEQGQISETIAIPFYEFTYGKTVQRVGFLETDDQRCGASPDGLLGSDGGLELKSPSPPVHLRYLMDGVIPKEYVLQVQFSLWVTKRAFWEFMSFSRQFDSLLVRTEPDPKIQKAIGEAVAQFSEAFDKLYAKVKGNQDEENARKTAEYYKSEGVA